MQVKVVVHEAEEGGFWGEVPARMISPPTSTPPRSASPCSSNARATTTSSFDALPARHQHRLRPRPPAQGRTAQRIGAVGEGQICTSIIVAAELRFGAAKRGSPRLSAQLEAVLGALDVLPFATPADLAYASLRARLERISRPIGGNDLLIAAHAIALGCAIVTDNERGFSQLKELHCENWLHETRVLRDLNPT